MKTILSALLLLPFLATAADSNWGTYLGDKASSHYSTLKQITPRNVARLEVAEVGAPVRVSGGGEDRQQEQG